MITHQQEVEGILADLEYEIKIFTLNPTIRPQSQNTRHAGWLLPNTSAALATARTLATMEMESINNARRATRQSLIQDVGIFEPKATPIFAQIEAALRTVSLSTNFNEWKAAIGVRTRVVGSIDYDQFYVPHNIVEGATGRITAQADSMDSTTQWSVAFDNIEGNHIGTWYIPEENLGPE